MEFMVAYYPIIKVLIVFVMFVIMYYLFVLEYFKSGAAVFIFGLFIYLMIPVHIDGTNQSKALQHESQYQDSKYTYQSDEIQQHHKTVLSFDEQMALIDKKNEVKNKKVQKDIKE